MKKFREKMAERAGFTLVELIVVIAILGILTAVAVPTYTGYIAKANDAADLQVLSNINTAAQGLAAGEGAVVSKIEVKCSADDGKITEITVTVSGTASVSQEDVCNLAFGSTTLPTTASFKGNYKVGAEWTSDSWTPKDLG